MNDKERISRNLNPHKEARLAMAFYGKRYAERGSGSMDFYDSLTDREKKLMKNVVDALELCTWRA